MELAPSSAYGGIAEIGASDLSILRLQTEMSNRKVMMAVTAKAFQLWRSQIAPHDNVSDVCRVAGIKRSTLAQQLVRGRCR